MRFLPFLPAILLLAACAGEPTTLQSSLPGITQLDTRTASGTQELSLDGVDTFLRSTSAGEVGSSLYLENGAGADLEWGIWRFEPPTGKTLGTLNVTLSPGATDNAWIGLADFAGQSWVFSGPFGGPENIDLAADEGKNFVSPGGFVYVAVLAEGSATAQIDSLQLVVEGNSPPVAEFVPTPQAGSPGEPVVLDASASSDSDGTIVSYEWDLDGDGVYETDFGGPTGNTTLPFPAGRVTVGLLVTDDEAATDTVMYDLLSMGDVWFTHTFDDYPDAGRYSSLAIVNGKPAISFYDAFNKELKYAYSGHFQGLSGWNVVGVDGNQGNEDIGRWTSLAVVNGSPGVPAISYINLTTGLKYARSTTADGSSGWETFTLDPNGGGTTSLTALANGNPAIAYRNWTDQDLYYTYYDAPNIQWVSLAIETAGSAGFYPSIAVVNGNPAISHVNGGVLRYARSSMADGSGGWSSTSVSPADGMGEYSSLAVLSSGVPAIASYDWDEFVVKYAYAGDANGSSWTVVGVSSPVVPQGQSCAMALIQGIPMISYRGGIAEPSDLKLAVSSNPLGDQSWTNSTIDSGLGAEPTSYTSIAEIDGKPAVSYFDETEQKLKYTIFFADES